jgi:hypothetical protein
LGQSTKSLRSSPLRGGKGRESGEDSDSEVARSTDQQAQCRRATHDQNRSKQRDHLGQHPDATNDIDPTYNAGKIALTD